MPDRREGRDSRDRCRGAAENAPGLGLRADQRAVDGVRLRRSVRGRPPGVDGVMLTKVNGTRRRQDRGLAHHAARARAWARAAVRRLVAADRDRRGPCERGRDRGRGAARPAHRVRRRRLHARSRVALVARGDRASAFRSALVLACARRRCRAADRSRMDRHERRRWFRVLAALGAHLGFQGKLCIHPDHVEPINRAFSPSADEIAKARRIVAAFRDAEARGSAASALDGALVDYAIVARAERTLEAAARIEARGEADETQ